jgi:Lon-like protease
MAAEQLPGPGVTRQTWTALVSAVAFIALAILLAFAPIPFVNWSPGGAEDTLGEIDGKPIIQISGIETYPTAGQLDMTIVASTPVDSRLSLPQALMYYWLPNRDSLPRDSVYPPGKSADQLQAEDTEMMETAKDAAAVAALQAANEKVTAMPVVYSVTIGGPAHTRLQPGDLVVSVDGVPTPDKESVGRAVRRHGIGEQLTFVVLRDKEQTEVEVTTVASTTQPDLPVVGITVDTGYLYEPEISFELGQQIGGPSAGLVFAVAIYDKITEGALLEGKHVAGTGTITPNGDVGGIGAIQEKIAAAESDGATAFLVPEANCHDLAGLDTEMTLIRVETLRDAIGALRELQAPDGSASIPRC